MNWKPTCSAVLGRVSGWFGVELAPDYRLDADGTYRRRCSPENAEMNFAPVVAFELTKVATAPVTVQCVHGHLSEIGIRVARSVRAELPEVIG